MEAKKKNVTHEKQEKGLEIGGKHRKSMRDGVYVFASFTVCVPDVHMRGFDCVCDPGSRS